VAGARGAAAGGAARGRPAARRPRGGAHWAPRMRLREASNRKRIMLRQPPNLEHLCLEGIARTSPIRGFSGIS